MVGAACVYPFETLVMELCATHMVQIGRWEGQGLQAFKVQVGPRNTRPIRDRECIDI